MNSALENLGIRRYTVAKTGQRKPIAEWLRACRRAGYKVSRDGLGWGAIKGSNDWAMIVAAGSYFRFRASNHNTPVPQMPVDMAEVWREGYSKR